MSNRSLNGWELHTAAVEHWAEYNRDEEQNEQDNGIPHRRPDRDNR